MIYISMLILLIIVVLHFVLNKRRPTIFYCLIAALVVCLITSAILGCALQAEPFIDRNIQYISEGSISMRNDIDVYMASSEVNPIVLQSYIDEYQRSQKQLEELKKSKELIPKYRWLLYFGK